MPVAITYIANYYSQLMFREAVVGLLEGGDPEGGAERAWAYPVVVPLLVVC